MLCVWHTNVLVYYCSVIDWDFMKVMSTTKKCMHIFFFVSAGTRSAGIVRTRERVVMERPLREISACRPESSPGTVPYRPGSPSSPSTRSTTAYFRFNMAEGFPKLNLSWIELIQLILMTLGIVKFCLCVTSKLPIIKNNLPCDNEISCGQIL